MKVSTLLSFATFIFFFCNQQAQSADPVGKLKPLPIGPNCQGVANAVSAEVKTYTEALYKRLSNGSINQERWNIEVVSFQLNPHLDHPDLTYAQRYQMIETLNLQTQQLIGERLGVVFSNLDGNSAVDTRPEEARLSQEIDKVKAESFNQAVELIHFLGHRTLTINILKNIDLLRQYPDGKFYNVRKYDKRKAIIIIPKGVVDIESYLRKGRLIFFDPESMFDRNHLNEKENIRYVGLRNAISSSLYDHEPELAAYIREQTRKQVEKKVENIITTEEQKKPKPSLH